MSRYIRVAKWIIERSRIVDVSRTQTLSRGVPTLVVEYMRDHVYTSGLNLPPIAILSGGTEIEHAIITIKFDTTKERDRCYERLAKIAAQNLEEL